MMVNLTVRLLLCREEKVWRSFLVPLDIDFTTLHTIIQWGFGWEDTHPHEFTYKKEKLIIDEDVHDMARACKSFDERIALFYKYGALLSDFIPPAKRIDYEYDFGDNWKHVIKVGKTQLVEGGPYALCTGGQGDTPPEDCGGPTGYEYLLYVLSDPTHERYKEKMEWIGYDGVVTFPFDIDSVNARLKRMEFIEGEP